MPTTPTPRRRPWQPKREAQQGRKERTGFYHTPPWRSLRNSFIAANPLCAECNRNNRITRGTMVDHIRPINRAEPYNTHSGQYPHPLERENLQTLCDSCHARKSARESHLKR